MLLGRSSFAWPCRVALSTRLPCVVVLAQPSEVGEPMVITSDDVVAVGAVGLASHTVVRGVFAYALGPALHQLSERCPVAR
jgi:hypothetical protein